jgi:hypothetical protein
MKALRIMLLILGCACILSNIGIIALSDSAPLPIGGDILQLLGLYVSKMALLFGGIVLVVFSSNLRAKAKSKQVA